MNIGVPAEIKPDERRVALTPAGAREFARRGHRMIVQRGAAEGELILKVTEPQLLARGRNAADGEIVHGTVAAAFDEAVAPA